MPYSHWPKAFTGIPPISLLPAQHRSDKPRQCRPGCAGRQHGRRIHTGLFPAESRRDGHQIETASTWLKRMQKHGLVENVDGKGNYRKPKSDIHFAHAYVCEAKGWMNLCTKCTNLTFTIPGLTFTPSNLRFKALPVQPLSAAPGQAYKSRNRKNRPKRKVRHANRDKGLSSVSVCGRQPPDKGGTIVWASPLKGTFQCPKPSFVN